MSQDDTHRNSPSSFTTIRHCHECGRTQNEDVRLQRCVGCYNVLYCSKPCQKKNWKTHKPICRRNGNVMMNPRSDWTQQLGSIGFDSVAVFTEALTQWLDAHKPALQMCADVALYRAGGMVRVSSADLEKQQMFLAPLVPRSSLDLPATRNPSLMFQLSGHFLFSLGDHLAKVPGFRHDWDRGAPIRTAMDERYADHPLYAGVLPVLISVAGLQLSQILYFPHFLPDPTSSPGEVILNAEQRIVAGDILHLVQSSVNAGFPIRQIGQEFSTPAVPGHYVRARGAWTWEKLFADWSDYRRGQHQGLDETLDGLTSGFSPRELMLAMKSWAFWYGTPPI